MNIVVRDKEGWICTYNGQFVRRLSRISCSFCKSGDPCSCNDGTPKKRYVINLKGCNGSGKSTIPMQMIEEDHGGVYLTASKEDKKPCAILVESLNTVIIGIYSSACGGCDSLSDTQVVKQILIKLWKKDVHILYEGVIVGDIKSTFYELMKEFNSVFARNLSFCFMGTRLNTCFDRIQGRNGGKEFNKMMVRAKYRNSQTHLQYYLEQGDIDCKVLDTTGSKAEVYARFRAMYPELGR